MKPIPSAWLVVYQFNGVRATYVTLDRSSAEQFAVRQRGTVHPLYTREY
jgi:hypothetical protein